MQTRSVDVAIIGAGTAGLAAYRAAKNHTQNVVIIEGGPYGTTCARVGCMPSKLLISAANAAHFHKTSSVFGVDYQEPQLRQDAIFERIRSERDRFSGFVVESVENFPEQDRIRGYAKFINDTQLSVESENSEAITVNAKKIVIATGSRPSIIPFMEAAGDRLLVNDDIFELKKLPKKVVVFGPGVIGLELGQALHRLGVDITMLGVGDALGPLSDPDIKDYAYQHFNDEFYLDIDAKVEKVDRQEDKVLVQFEHKSQGFITEEFDYLVAATGRRPNVDKLGLENTSLVLSDRGMPEFDTYTLQCGNSNIFIAGDVNNFRPLLHEAADEGKIAGENAARFPDVRAGNRRTPIGVVFSEPQIATVGLSLQQVKDRCQQCYATGSVSFEDQGRSRVMAVNHGLLKVYGEQGTGLFLGAEMFGPAAEHIAHLLSWAVQMRMTVSQMLEMPFYHPVIEEGVRTALRDLNHKLHIGPEVVERCLDCGPGA
ncbi:dihydrolipoyl dehydrogenase [Sessilibacter corallicola]|uniref:dihydrolipoyl dehydrogenase n=1 Tax=Sessilibacter corallicola TaxID=2904075 RepID=UPI001E2E4595|nr:dihydrolipoyl dehydrogenase [Sessilibacter corallicola]MCE2027655.1 dihydrolipoyl dehydrogenase [Sessilibacter corallicola]